MNENEKPGNDIIDPCHCEKHKERSDDEKRSLINRLSRIEGQIRGLKGMVENDAYCPDILTQAAAVNSAINAFNRALLCEHIRTCVTEDIREGRDETVEELMALVKRLVR